MILIVSPVAGLYGGTERTLQLLLEQSSASDGIAVAFLEDGPLVAATQARGIRTRVFPRGRFRNPARTLHTVRKLRQFATEVHASAMFAWTEFAQLYAGMAAWGYLPSFWWQRGHVNRGHTRLLRAIPYRLAVGNSHFTTARLVDLGVRCRPEPLYPGLNRQRFQSVRDNSSKLAARVRLGLPMDGLLIGSVGRLQAWKGFGTFVEALSILQADQPSLRGVIVGGRHDLEPHYEASLHGRIRHLGMSDSILVAGGQSNVADWLAAMDVFVHAGQNEPFGMVIVEAMTTGVPVVATYPGGTIDFVDAGVNGLLVPFGDAEQMAGAIKLLISDTEYAETISSEAIVSASRFGDVNLAREIRALVSGE